MIRKDKIIAILDLDTAASNSMAQNLINNVLKKGQVQNISEERKEKSVIIAENGYYLSPISSITLLKRSSMQANFD